MCPRAAVRDIKVIAAGFGLESRRAVCGNAIAENAFGSLELACLASFLCQFAISPFAADQNAHDNCSNSIDESVYRNQKS
jgi:hypothetical protein